MKSLKKIIYGDGIASSIQKDDILRVSNTEDGAAFCAVPPVSDSDMELWSMFCQLRRSGLIRETRHNVFRITEDGKQFLAEGGFEGLVKKEKVYIYAFHISIVSIFISIVTLLAGIFGWFSRS